MKSRIESRSLYRNTGVELNNNLIFAHVVGSVSIDLDAIGDHELQLQKVAPRTAELCFR